uniref:transmembrane protein 229B-like n=1 Tax=Semicossyphus pulcher TaxID=241346 RepID=UPI0037E978BB
MEKEREPPGDRTAECELDRPWARRGVELVSLAGRRPRGAATECLKLCVSAVTNGALAWSHDHHDDEGRPLSAAARLYVYALHGLLCEVVFTALWDGCSSGDVRLGGHSSLWALPMYASAIFVMERLRRRLLAQPLTIRLIAYTLFIYLWEFSWGAGLSLLGACPWDYSGYRFNVGGLVTLEYAVFWAGAAFIAESHVIKTTLRLRLRS